MPPPSMFLPFRQWEACPKTQDPTEVMASDNAQAGVVAGAHLLP